MINNWLSRLIFCDLHAGAFLRGEDAGFFTSEEIELQQQLNRIPWAPPRVENEYLDRIPDSIQIFIEPSGKFSRF